MRRPEQIDNSLIDLVSEHAPVSRKTLLDAYRRRYDDERTMRSLDAHLAQLVASGALERVGVSSASRYKLGQKELERRRLNGKHARLAHAIERPDVAELARRDDLVEQEVTTQDTTTTDAQASSGAGAVAQQESSQVEQIVDHVLALVVDSLRPALMQVVDAHLAQRIEDCDEALRIAEQAQADLAAYRQRVKALLSEE